MNKKTIRDYEITGKKVLLRVDYNVPIENGAIRDDFRIKASLPTLEYLLEQKCALILISHLGRPDGKPDPKFSLRPAAEALSKLVGKPVKFIDSVSGEQAKQAASGTMPGELTMLENLRFDPREESNDPQFARYLASLADVYVDDAFAVIHRAHASTSGVPKFLPALSGLLVEKEVTGITSALENPKRPFVAMIGGAKVSDKIEVLDNLLKKVDTLVIGGAMANTFFAAKGINVGKSVYEPEQVATAKQIMDTTDVELMLPTDVVAAKSIDPPADIRAINTVKDLGTDELIVDLGKQSIKKLCGKITEAGTVIWNGPFGLTEIAEFASGSLELARCLAESKAASVIGGGDTADFIDSAGLHEKFDLVSTGGGAALELMAGKKLPGVEALLDKSVGH